MIIENLSLYSLDNNNEIKFIYVLGKKKYASYFCMFYSLINNKMVSSKGYLSKKYFRKAKKQNALTFINKFDEDKIEELIINNYKVFG